MIEDVRKALGNSVRNRLPSRGTLGSEAVAGLTVAVGSIPSAMTSGLLAGVNPIHGLYATAVGPIVGGAFSSSALMVINATSATAIVAGQALIGIEPGAREAALFMLVALSGVFQILFGILRLGSLTHFVSFSVMTGFLVGIAAVLVMSQLPTITGIEAAGPNRLAQTYDLLLNLWSVHLPTLGLAGLTLALTIGLTRTRVGSFSSLVAIIVVSVIALVPRLEGVRLVRDVGDVGGSLIPALPVLSAFSIDIVTGALSLALVVLIQGAGVSQSVPNPDASRNNLSRDFIAQGAANIAAGLFRGSPVGGSIGSTALNLVSGGRRRWAAIFSGVWVGIIVVALSGAVSRVAMPALGALLILAAIRSVKKDEIASIWRAGWLARGAAIATFVATLFLPIQIAVGFGVILSAFMFVVATSVDVSVVELVERDDGRLEERDPPRTVPGGEVTVLDVYGDLFYGGARTMERLLPQPGEERRPAVVLRLRGRRAMGATLVEVLSAYAQRVRAAGGRLYVTGLQERAYRQLLAAGPFDRDGPCRVYPASRIVGEATEEAWRDAEGWVNGTGTGKDKGTVMGEGEGKDRGEGDEVGER